MTQRSVWVKDLKKYYGSLRAVDGIDLEVESGTIFGMLGPNGAGKTTTIETLVGLKERNGGDVNILGFDPALDAELKKLKTRIGVQLQSPALFPRLTVGEIIKLFASFYPDPLSIDEVLDRVGLKAKINNRVKSLSGGQQHRLAVALAMVSNGDLIFLDEPTTGLDPKARRQLWDVIGRMKQEGTTVFLTTHYMEEAEKLCDKLVIIDKGEIIARGTPQGLINQYFKERALEFTDPGFSSKELKELEEAKLTGRLNYNQENNKLIIYTEDVTSSMNQLFKFTEKRKKDIEDIKIRHATLEDVFLKLTGRGIN